MSDPGWKQEAERWIRAGRLSDAAEICRKRLAEWPQDADGNFLLGSLFALEKRWEESERCLRMVLEVCPDHLDALYNLGVVLSERRGHHEEAEALFRSVLEKDTGHVKARMNLGALLQRREERDEAEEHYRKALSILPEDAGLLNNLGSLYTYRGEHDQAAGLYERALRVLPGDAEVLANLMTSYIKLGRAEDCIGLVDRILSLPDPGPAACPVFLFTRMYGLWDRADPALTHVLKLIFDGRATLSAFDSVNLPLLASRAISNESLFEIHRMTGKTIEDNRLSAPFQHHPLAMSKKSRMRIGYISPDFRQHVVAVFFRGVVNHHDRERFEIFLYSNVREKDEDSVTEQYKASVDGFLNISGMGDAEAARRIHEDGIHILVDLAGYTQNGRVGVLSYRPAPIQMMYLGYPYTSGLETVDYYLSDPYLNGPENARFFTERQLPLPESFITFDKLIEQEVEPGCPFARNGYVTFGTLNNTYKIGPRLIEVWSRILARVPRSRLVINHPNCRLAATRRNIVEHFAGCGIEADRIEIVWEKHPSGSHLRYYNDLDIALDTFPLTGGTTTIDAVWMGVPVVTLVGEIHHQRLSYSILKNTLADADDLVAFTEDEYVEKAVALAGRPDRIVELHRALPVGLRASTLCDPLRLTRHLETAFEAAWKEKYPGEAIIWKREADFAMLRSGLGVAVSGGWDDLSTYVLREQGAWFDPELIFVRDFLRPGMQLLEVGSGIGACAVELAARVGAGGKVWVTVETPLEAGMILKSRDRNNLSQLDVLVGGDRKPMLDMESVKADLAGVDLVRINADILDTTFLEDGKKFFAETNALVMFRVKGRDGRTDTGIATRFEDLGFGIYRLTPGLKLLVPLKSFKQGEHLDDFTMNLFACRGGLASRLEQDGMLIMNGACDPGLPGIHIRDWQVFLAAFPYSITLMSGWEDGGSNHPGNWEVYWSALNLYARSREGQRSVAERFASLRASGEILDMLSRGSPTLPRLLSFARVLVDLGERQRAVSLLDGIYALFETEPDLALNEPFLALSDEYASMEPGGRVAQWLFASVLERRETLRAFSSYFTGQESLPVYEAVQKTGFFGEEVERRIQLLRARFGQQAELDSL